ncbi:ABC transporter ATP-binding protein [Cyanobium sp. BA5m-10]|uniref:ABC transporter ATP-binding protein n=1 Tax=Cyanobium sp. BA5m-10 TaxID=2823705 RepID=UPI0020CD7799|nr:ABC transporter ATP-binding protein [Cyanobium sp. BA5m-10]
MNLTVARGETLGIIGCNGSGKSTLLQMICGTLTPTEGSVRTKGRIAALLELGSGFNPEFTGRENVAINARLLGLSEKEVRQKFDEIVEFSEISQFIDQPVKTYSSGMFVRLAFAIASHSDPDILIVDEALSVGDIAFQNKCMMRIKKLRDNGLTLIFVSHDLSTLQLICDRAIWIHKGMLKEAGDPVQVAQEYYALTANNIPEGSHANSKGIPQQNTGMGIFLKAEMLRSQEESLENCYHPGSNVRIMFSMQTLQRIERCIFNISIFSNDGIWMVGQSSLEQGVIWPATEAGNCLSGMIELANLCLAPGNYKAALSACSVDLSICYALSDLYLSFSVRSDRPTWGRVRQPCNWTINDQDQVVLQ